MKDCKWDLGVKLLSPQEFETRMGGGCFRDNDIIEINIYRHDGQKEPIGTIRISTSGDGHPEINVRAGPTWDNQIRIT